MSDAENRTDADLETVDAYAETQELDPDRVEEIRATSGRKVGELSEEELDGLLETPEFQFVDRTREIDLSQVPKKK